jgi:uncharacterized membrane protein (DUF485 family)
MREDAGLTPEQARRLGERLMKEQAALGLRVAAVFAVLLFGLPLLNWFLPDIMGQAVAGFTPTWLLLGVLFFPITWFLSLYFVRESNRIEEEHGRELRAGEPMAATDHHRHEVHP